MLFIHPALHPRNHVSVLTPLKLCDETSLCIPYFRSIKSSQQPIHGRESNAITNIKQENQYSYTTGDVIRFRSIDSKKRTLSKYNKLLETTE